AKIPEDLGIAGLEMWADSAVIVRCRFKGPPREQLNARREVLRGLKGAFYERRVEIPGHRFAVYAGQGKGG
ncbi:MAG TPA: mechanosensitive ion channel family protein, partial [Burkholderiales bacterium]|nr:mechanosensitive ion channel family protein [Burkholderiales bacterium]